VSNDELHLATVYRETLARVHVLSLRVAEGKDVQGASEFCRWFIFSGLIPLLKSNANDKLPPLKIDGAFLEFKINDLLQACNSRMSVGQVDPNFSAAYLQSLHEKIDLMASHLGRLSVAGAVAVTPVTQDDGQNESETEELSRNGTNNHTEAGSRAERGSGLSLIKG
jgi:hypothetical protein